MMIDQACILEIYKKERILQNKKIDAFLIQ